MKWLWPGVAVVAGAVVAGLHYAGGRRTINNHVRDYAAHWGDRAASHPDDVLHYVALGDSAAQGVGASAVGNGYVARIARRLEEATGRSVAVTNLSVSGAVSGDVVRDQLPQFVALGLTPDIVTLDIGGNDVVFPGNDVASFGRSLAAILDALPPGSFVADVPWFMVPGLARQSRQMAARAAELVNERGHHLVHLHRASRATGVLKYHRFTADDWFHPNDQGYLGWADEFWAAIEASGRLAELRAS